MISTGELRKGAVIELDGELWQILDYHHIKMGRGSAQSGGSTSRVIASAPGQTRVWYSPVRVSMRMVSPCSTKIGTCTTRPVSVVAGLRAPDCVSPAKPGSVSTTLRSTVTGSSTPIVSPW